MAWSEGKEINIPFPYKQNYSVPTPTWQIKEAELSSTSLKGGRLSVRDRPHNKQHAPSRHQFPPQETSLFPSLPMSRISPPFARLPLELRFEIASQIVNWEDFNAFRHIDKTNHSSLPTFGIRGEFQLNRNEYLFVQWLAEQMFEFTITGDLVREIIQGCNPTLPALQLPLRHLGHNLEAFTETRAFFLKARDIANKTTGFRVDSRFLDDTGYQWLMQPHRELQHVVRLNWNLFGNTLDEEARSRLNHWVLAISSRFYEFELTPGGALGVHARQTSLFERVVIEALGRYINDLFYYLTTSTFFTPEAADQAVAAMEEELKEVFELVMRLYAWEQLANGSEGTASPLLLALTDPF